MYISIYQTCSHAVQIHAIGARAGNNKTERALEVAEISVLRDISGKTRQDRVQNQSIREDIVHWGYVKYRCWNQRTFRMSKERLVRATKDSDPEDNSDHQRGHPNVFWTAGDLCFRKTQISKRRLQTSRKKNKKRSKRKRNRRRRRYNSLPQILLISDKCRSLLNSSTYTQKSPCFFNP